MLLFTRKLYAVFWFWLLSYESLGVNNNFKPVHPHVELTLKNVFLFGHKTFRDQWSFVEKGCPPHKHAMYEGSKGFICPDCGAYLGDSIK